MSPNWGKLCVTHLQKLGILWAVWFGFTSNNPNKILKHRFVQGEIQHLVVSWKMKAAYKFHLIAKHKHFWPNSFHLGPEPCCFVRSTRKKTARSAHQKAVRIVKVQDPAFWYVLAIVELQSWNNITQKWTAFVIKNAGNKIWLIWPNIEAGKSYSRQAKLLKNLMI